MSRAKTKVEIKEEFMSHMRSIAKYWAGLPDKTPHERCDGVAFSILAMIDGCSFFPALDIAVHPHPDDMEYHKKNGENWYEPGMVFNDDTTLHDEWHSAKKT